MDKISGLSFVYVCCLFTRIPKFRQKTGQLLVNKAMKKGRSKTEADEIIRWLTGYFQAELEGMLHKPVSYADFFRNAPELNPNRVLIKGTVFGVFAYLS